MLSKILRKYGNKQGQAGETIIEVLLALTVLGLALGLSYSSAGRSLKGSRDSQEHTEASQIAASAVDAIRHYATNADLNANAHEVLTADSFCIRTELSNVSNFDPLLQDDDPACTYSGLYKTAVGASHDAATTTHQYVIAVTWDSLVNAAGNQVVMRYSWVEP